MTLTGFRRRMHQALKTRSRPLAAPTRPRFRPGLEALEDRTLPAFAIALAADPPTITFGQPITLTASLATDQEGPLPPGHVVFKDGATTVGDVPLPDDVAATFQAVLPTTPALTIGTHHLTAEYRGSTQIVRLPGGEGGATSGVTAGQTIGVAETVLATSNPVDETVTAPPTPAPPPAAPTRFDTTTGLIATDFTFRTFILRAQVSGGPTTPTGQVLFFRDNTLLGSARLNGGLAVRRGVLASILSARTTSPHAVPFRAVYLGDATHEASEARPAIAPRLSVKAGMTRPDPSHFLFTYTVGLDTSFTRELNPTEAGLPVPAGVLQFSHANGHPFGSTPISVTPAIHDATGEPLYYTGKVGFRIRENVRQVAVGDIPILVRYVGDPFYPPAVFVVSFV